MPLIETEPTPKFDQIYAFHADIEAYHDALRFQTGCDNPDIIINDLFAFTDPHLHSELTAAIWSLTDGGWSVTQRLDSDENSVLILSRAPLDRFRYA